MTGPAVSPGLIVAPPPDGGAAAIFSPGTYHEAFWPWAAWKNRELLGLADELMAEARGVRPGLRFALNLYYETMLNPHMALAWYAQSIQAAGAHPFDYYSLMSYHRQIAKELTYTPEEALEAIAVMSRQAAAAAGDPAKVIVKIQALDWDSQQLIPAAELDRALAAPARGVSLGFVGSLDDMRKMGGDTTAFLRTAVLAEFGKQALTGLLCAVVFIWVKPLAGGFFFLGMIGVLVANWIGLARTFTA